MDEPIGDDVIGFLSEYYNNEIREFIRNMMCYISNFRKLEGYPSITEEWAQNKGLKTYSHYIDPKGRAFFIEHNTGRVLNGKSKGPLKSIKYINDLINP